MAHLIKNGIMDILYVMNHDVAGRPLDAASDGTLDSDDAHDPQCRVGSPSATAAAVGQPLPRSASVSLPPLPALTDDESWSHARSSSIGVMSPYHSSPCPSIASPSENGPESADEANYEPSVAASRKNSSGKLQGGKEYWTEEEDSVLVRLVKHNSAEGRKHWKDISGQMSRSREACRTRWKILAKDLRILNAAEESEVQRWLDKYVFFSPPPPFLVAIACSSTRLTSLVKAGASGAPDYCKEDGLESRSDPRRNPISRKTETQGRARRIGSRSSSNLGEIQTEVSKATDRRHQR